MRRRAKGIVSGNVLETPTYVVTVHCWSEERVAAPFDGIEIDDDRPPPRWVYLNVSYRNKDVRPIRFHKALWRVADADGYRYEPAMAVSYLFESRDRPPLESGDLAPADLVRGWLAFRPRELAVVERALIQTSVLAGDTLAMDLAAVPRLDPDGLTP